MALPVLRDPGLSPHCYCRAWSFYALQPRTLLTGTFKGKMSFPLLGDRVLLLAEGSGQISSPQLTVAKVSVFPPLKPLAPALTKRFLYR